ncbi:MAG: Asp-tRNA(Asn)/Glu-tRNA(Gln) amidotransferase subunit GatB [Nannocystaceae bacterium]
MNTSRWETVIGLEVHCQLKTKSKLFSACGFVFGAEPNTQTDPYTWAHPGTLPVPNREAVRFAIRLALATSSDIQQRSRFARKHYFYPDLPKGYQITQSDHPYCLGGHVVIPPGVRRPAKTVRLVRIHIEEDAGKNTHLAGKDISLVDYNRAGVPLLEIVSEPDIRSAQEASAYMRELRAIVRYLAISHANMEEGTLRCDANVSLRVRGTQAYGTRCEIKNLNSFKFLEAAINAEVRRQTALLDDGGSVVQCTMSYDTMKDCTRVMRTKEEAADYRYFPDPDLPPLNIDNAWIADERSRLPELPAARRKRYAAMGLRDYDVDVLVGDPALATFFDRTIALGGDAKKVCNWITVELLARLKADRKRIERSPVSPARMHELVALVESGTISGRVAKELFDKIYREDLTPSEVMARDGYQQMSDPNLLEELVTKVLANHPGQVEQYRRGKTKIRGFFVGQVMKRSEGQANPGMVNQLLDALLPKPEN